jgi:hypothetical protein
MELARRRGQFVRVYRFLRRKGLGGYALRGAAAPLEVKALMLSTPPPDEAPEARELRGAIFTDLDRLAFALEMEAAELLEQGLDDEARCRQELRLGVRLAQRLVAGVWADEVNLRIRRHRAAYDSRLEPVGG